MDEDENQPIVTDMGEVNQTVALNYQIGFRDGHIEGSQKGYDVGFDAGYLDGVAETEAKYQEMIKSWKQSQMH